MFYKTRLIIRSLLLKNLVFLFFLISLNSSGQTITRIYTDWKGYWTSASAPSPVGSRPDDLNNLTAFTWKTKTYSTGVDDAMLTSKGIVYTPQKFRALKIQTLGYTTDSYFLQGSMIDGSLTDTKLTPPLAGTAATGAELASRLTDGINGLALGTGIANIKIGTSEFKIGTNNLNIDGLNDGKPDVIVTQVASPGGDPDIFRFVDKDGNTVGTPITVNFGSVTAIGTYSLDLFRADNGVKAFTAADTREIRMLGFEVSDFNITAALAPSVDRFVINFSGSSDCAFIAFNANSLKLSELSLVKTATLPSCGKLGDVIDYTFTVTNTGEVPITNINVTDAMAGMVITGNPAPSFSLAVNATITMHGTYTIKAADVTAGKVINSAKVTGIDPSLNAIEDISGTANNNNIATTTILLAPPNIGAITNVTCTDLGTVVLNDLPAGNWTIDRTPSGAGSSISSSGTSRKITGLAAGHYTFKITTSAGCHSPASADVEITNQSSTTWTGSPPAWSNGIPNATKSAVFAAPFTITSDLNICSCTVNSGISITVPSVNTLKVENFVKVVTGGSLIFENNASLIQTNTGSNINSGNITYRRDSQLVRRYDVTYWSTPVTSTPAITLHDLSPDTLGDKYYSYEPTTGWAISYRGELPMVPGQGYNIRAPQTFDINTPSIFNGSFVGVPNNGNVPFNTVAGKFNLVGNPYPSAIDGVKFMTVNSSGALYFWTHNTPPIYNPADNKYKYSGADYAVYTLAGGTGTASGAAGATGNIASGQAYFIKPTTNSIVFTNDMRVGMEGKNGQFFKNTEEAEQRNRLWLNFTNDEGGFKQALLGYMDGATNLWDLDYDAATLNGNTYIDFYSINDSRKLTIQGRALPFDESETIPLGYKTSIEGNFTISIDHTDGFFNSQAVYLEDKTAGKVQDLRAGNYTFTTTIGTFTDRFVLRYTNKSLGTGDFENLDNSVLVSVKDKIIKVNSSKEIIKDIAIYDILGKLLYNKKKLGTNEFQISNIQSANQVLLVKVTLENDFTTTSKIIF